MFFIIWDFLKNSVKYGVFKVLKVIIFDELRVLVFVKEFVDDYFIFIYSNGN